MILGWFLACAAPDDTADSCASAPVLSWADVGEPLILEHCDTCHAATSADRHGAPEAITFDTEADVQASRTLMIGVLDHSPATMPPVIGLPEEDRQLLLSWLRCDVR